MEYVSTSLYENALPETRLLSYCCEDWLNLTTILLVIPLRHSHYILCLTSPPTRHGPKPGCQEAEAFSILEAEALTLSKLEAEAKALVTKPKPGYLYRAKYESGLQSRSFGQPRSRSLWKSRSQSQALKNLGSRSRSFDPKKSGFVKPKSALAHVCLRQDEIGADKKKKDFWVFFSSDINKRRRFFYQIGSNSVKKWAKYVEICWNYFYFPDMS